MTRTVAALTELGLVTRTPHPHDRRQIVVTVTAQGAAVARETRRRRDAWLARRLAELPPAEREVLAQAGEILRRIAAS
jgi:DNA-binding MarR family transcriptional regulator